MLIIYFNLIYVGFKLSLVFANELFEFIIHKFIAQFLGFL